MSNFNSICFINGRVTTPFYQGGDGVYINNLLIHFNKHYGIKVLCIGYLGDLYTESEITRILTSKNIQVCENNADYITYKLVNDFNAKLYKNLELFLQQGILEGVKSEYEILFTQINYSHIVIDINSKQCKKPLIHFVHDTHELNKLSLEKQNDISLIVYNSIFTKNKLNSIYHTSARNMVLYPSVLKIKQAKTLLNKKILFINPVTHKGVQIMIELVQKMKDSSFIIQFSYDETYLETFKRYSNVEIHKKTHNMSSVYEKTDLVIVPAIWEEPFGMIIIEANSHGIPVIASNKGGIPEALGDAGILLNDPISIDDWIYNIEAVLNSNELYEFLSNKAILNASKCLVNEQVERLEDAIQKII